MTHTDAHCSAVFEALSERYRHDGRHYHDHTHIDQCLGKLDEVTAAVDGYHPDDMAIVELAIWFHDAVYTAGSPDNETQSADWFREQAKGHLRPDSIARIDSLIEATEHQTMPLGKLESLMVDIDLSSFSTDRHTFLADGRNIRQEFEQLSDQSFVAGQTVFLRALLDRPSIYSTPYFKTRYEEIARRNIKDLLEMYRPGFAPGLGQN